MEELEDLFAGRMRPGLRVERVVRRPHETRVFLRDAERSGLQVRFRGREAWTWHPVDPGDVWAFDLDQAQREAIRRAVAAVAARDVEAVRALLGRDAGDFWTWVDGVDLAVPPGPVEDWELDGFPLENGLYVHVDMWGHIDGDLVPLDETLRMQLGRADGGWAARLEDLHVL